MKRTTIRGTPINHVGPSGAFVGNREGYGAASSPPGYDGQTTKDQFRGTGMSTAQGPGTPYNSQPGNPDETLRTASSGRYGIVRSENGQDHNNSSSNGTGVLLDGTSDVDNGYLAAPAQTLDSPVPARAPRFDPKDILTENLAHLGKDQPETLVEGDLVKIGGVMSR